jgi:hypothetical protein
MRCASRACLIELCWSNCRLGRSPKRVVAFYNVADPTAPLSLKFTAVKINSETEQ